MKSLVEEASSVVKAIEKAWNRAGNPQTFSVKVYEVPETNFFGFTTKSAKVGIFFEEEVQQPVKKYTNNRDNRSQSNNRQHQKGRDGVAQTRDFDAEQPARPAQNRQARPQTTTRPVAPTVQQPRAQEPVEKTEAQAPRSRDTERPSRGNYEQRPRRNDRNDRYANDRNDRTDRAAAPRHQEERPVVKEYAEPVFEEKRTYQQEEPTYQQPVHTERYEDAAPRYERDNRRTNDDRDQDSTPREHSAPRYERDNRRNDSRGNDRRGGSQGRQGGRTDNRPARAQRHEFDEHREMVNMPQDNQPSTYSEPSVQHVAPEVQNTSAPSLIPQKKVLKVSGRRYSAPVKPQTDNE